MDVLRQIEEKWRKAWEEARIFEADPDPNRKKCMVTFPFSYMNGPLHVGHGFTATRVDAYVRFKRMQGYNVLFPWAWHWTGETIAGASERIKDGDEEFIHALRDIDGVSEENLKKFVDPTYMASYYTKVSRKAVKRMGFSIDWRREFHTTSLCPTFSKFIEWQCERLHEKGYIVQGTYPVVWCPRCESPTGDHDRQVGEGVAPEEYVLMKFKMGDAYLPAATFRPETIYGVTNMWIHPDADYVKAQVNGEQWVISEIAANKLEEQKRKIAIISKFKGREIIGKHFVSPLNNRKMLVLPGWFVSPSNATGVVYSVPAHAPFDWVALRDLQGKPELLKEFGIDADSVKKIQPISMIRVDGFGEHPAVEMVERMGVKDQYDLKAEEATKLLYKKEFHSGVLKDICGEHSGKMVSEMKESLIQDFKEKGFADSMHDLPQPVVCRCLTPCVVKILEDQWFLKYSDEAWKEKAKEALSKASVYPKSAIQWFLNIIDWLREWPCARKTGLGTPLPWSPGWIVETLTDSTVYMAFYTINKHIKQYDIKAAQLSHEVFDYLFYGRGDVKKVAEKSRVNRQVLESMRSEFLYWYPLDLRVSAKELVPNHLTFFLFHHAALFPKHLPKAIGVNGVLSIEGKKMSKSKGNFVTLRSALDQYGADATRCALLLGGEGMGDPDWRSENVRDVRVKLKGFYNLANGVIETAREKKVGHLEEWLISVLQHRIKNVTENMEVLKTRTATENALFEVWNDFRWYARRKGKTDSKVLKHALETWVRLLAPFAPYVCEEIWNKIESDDFVSLAEWPRYDEQKVNLRAEEAESLIKNVLEDTSNILRATKMVPKKICYYSAAPWKWKAYLTALKKSTSAKITLNDLMKELMTHSDLKEMAKKVSKFARQIVDEANQMPDDKRNRLVKIESVDEHQTLREAESFFEGEFNAKIYVYGEEDPQRHDPKKKAELARPYRPAIYIE
ncbi:MAG: leucine--tRNA ligase [Candidatus Bathyarchaeota archaeon]|nr:MAG: leucine--tRNA ligase [Candidatus Bathyarchaeota archaeon]